MAVNPVPVTCPADVWTPVAIDVTTGILHKLQDGTYVHTYVVTGEDAPTTAPGAAAFKDSTAEIINATTGIDVYIKAVGKPGKIRADL